MPRTDRARSQRTRKAERSPGDPGPPHQGGKIHVGSKGYAATAMEHLVAKAGMTRGALYHRDRDKRTSSGRCSRPWRGELGQRIAVEMAAATAPWAQLRAGARAFLLGMVRAVCEINIAAGNIAAQPVEPLAHLIVGTLNDAALAVAAADDANAACDELAESMFRILDSLRAVATAAHQ